MKHPLKFIEVSNLSNCRSAVKKVLDYYKAEKQKAKDDLEAQMIIKQRIIALKQVFDVDDARINSAKN